MSDPRHKPNILVFAECFPPSTAVGTRRTLALVGHLNRQGWGVTVITAWPEKGTMVDESILADLPGEIRVVQVRPMNLHRLALRLRPGGSGRAASPVHTQNPGPEAHAVGETADQSPRPLSGWRKLADWLSWWLLIPDSRAVWATLAAWSGLLRSFGHTDIIYSSAPAWSSHLAAAMVSRLINRPLVADFRDPWCGSAYRPIPYRAHRRLDEYLERRVMARSSAVVCAWEGIARHLRQSYPAQADHIRTVWNGFDPAQIDSAPAVRLVNGQCVLLHAGNFYGPRSPLPLLEGLSLLRRRRADLPAVLRVILAGLEHYNGTPLIQMVAAHGLEDLVDVLGPLPHGRSLSLLKGADVALLFGQSGREDLASVPAKIYEYIGAGKAVLALGAGTEVCSLLRKGGCRLWEALTPGEVAEAVERILGEHAAGPTGWQGDRAARENFTHQQMSREIQAILEQVVRGGRRVSWA